jgi:hypothetical protein
MATVKGIAINDLHFGIASSARTYDELKKIFLPFVESHDIQIININGDYFDRKLTLTESSTLYAIGFFNDLCEVCLRKGIKLRLVEGTMSHDMMQGSVLEQAAPDGLDFKFIQSLADEDICGMHVLYAPEEYPINSKEFYGPYMAKKYNIIHGHGTWDFLAYKGMIVKAARTDIQTAPVFMYDDWKESLEHGFATFGHIHSRHVMQDKIFYSGSFSAWDYTDISARGFVYYEVDTETGDYKVQFIDNNLCPKFGIIDCASINCDKTIQHIGDLINAIEAAASQYDFARADLDGLPSDTITALRIKYSVNPKIKTFIKVQDKPESLQESDDTRFDKYKYIFDGVLPVEDVIHKYIFEEKGKDISLDVIRNTITPKQEASNESK